LLLLILLLLVLLLLLPLYCRCCHCWGHGERCPWSGRTLAVDFFCVKKCWCVHHGLLIELPYGLLLLNIAKRGCLNPVLWSDFSKGRTVLNQGFA
jgi:hypothetical protein